MATKPLCPCFVPARGHSFYRVGGICKGLPHGLPMLPTVQEHAAWCASGNYEACPIYRSRRDARGLTAWLREQYEVWGVPPLASAA